MGSQNFWGMINIMKKAELSARDMVMMLPPSGRVRCLQALMAEIEATPPPEALRHAMPMSQERAKARQLFATADPVRFIGDGGVPGIIAGAPAGLSTQVEADNALQRTIDTFHLRNGTAGTRPSMTLSSSSHTVRPKF